MTDTIPELVGAAEAAALLGIGTPNFSHLRADEEKKGDASLFPKPIQVLRCGPIWRKDDMAVFASTYGKRKPGAPKKNAVSEAPRIPTPTKRLARPKR